MKMTYRFTPEEEAMFLRLRQFRERLDAGQFPTKTSALRAAGRLLVDDDMKSALFAKIENVFSSMSDRDFSKLLRGVVERVRKADNG